MNEDIATIEARAEALIEAHECLMRDLIALRTKHNLSQEEVAVRMGVTQPTVSNFERYDSNPRLSTIRRYALAVGGIIENTVVDDCIAHSDRVFDAVRIDQIFFAAHPTPPPAGRAWVWTGLAQNRVPINVGA